MWIVAADIACEQGQASAFVTQCAWCGAVKRGGGYAEKYPIVPKLEGRGVSHGICPHCYDRALASRFKAGLS